MFYHPTFLSELQDLTFGREREREVMEAASAYKFKHIVKN